MAPLENSRKRRRSAPTRASSAGTAFAFCEESGIRGDLKQQVIQLSREGRAAVFTDPLASPTGFPFKVVQLAGTASDASGQHQSHPPVRSRAISGTRTAKADGTTGYRCPAEPVEDYVRKGGAVAETEGRQCVCNGLTATIGFAQIRPGGEVDLPLITAGNEVANIAGFLRPGALLTPPLKSCAGCSAKCRNRLWNWQAL